MTAPLLIRNTFFCLVLLFLSHYSQAKQPNSPTVFYQDSTIASLANILAKDLNANAQFTLTTTNENAIYLIMHKTQISELRKEGFQIKSNANRIIIAANHLNGLANGVYYYLHYLGFRFYLPGDIWTYNPTQINNYFSPINITKYPAFENRFFFGTGGMPYNSLTDKEKRVQTLWNDWSYRNRWSSEEYIGGHIGESFNKKYESILRANTQWLAKVKSKREWRIGAKWCISNAQFRSFFIKDRIEAWEVQKQKNPDRNLISVDPADGEGHCECTNCSKLGTVSDRVFLLANEVAELLKAKHAFGGVSLYAYSMHAQPPKQKLVSNVHVLLIPYAYQNVASPEVLVQAWSSKTNNIGIYDYLNITDASKDIPTYDYLTYLKTKVDFWKTHKVKGYTLESAYSKFSAGLPLYMVSRMAWHETESPSIILKEFCTNMFGEAADIMELMFRKWANNFNPVTDINTSYKSIKMALQKEKRTVVQKRLKELEHYIIYIDLFTAASTNFKTHSAKEKIEQTIKFIWSVYDECLINTSRIHQYFLLRPIREIFPDFVAKWSLANVTKQEKLWQETVTKQPSSLIKHFSLQKENSNSSSATSEVHKLLLSETIVEREPNWIIWKTLPDLLQLQSGQRLYLSLNTDDNTSFTLDIELLGDIKKGSIPSISIYDMDKAFLTSKTLISVKKGEKETIQFSGLEKNKRYNILFNLPGPVFDLKIQNLKVIIDASHPYNKYVRVLSSQQIRLLLDPGQSPLNLSTVKKGKAFLPNSRKPISGKEPYIINPDPEKYLVIDPEGSHALQIKLYNKSNLYYFY